MIEGPGQKPATLNQIFEQRQPDWFGIHKGEVLRGDVTEGGIQNKQLYIHAQFMPGHGGQTALARRLEKVKGAQIVAAAIAKDYGPTVAENVLRAVHEKTNREVWKEVTRGDLHLLHDELQLQLIKDDLTANWTSAAKEEFYPIGGFGDANVAGTRSMDGGPEGYYPIQELGDGDIVGLRPLMYELKKGPGNAEVGGPRPIYGVKEEYSSIPWPDSDAKVGLRDAVYTNHIQQGWVQFDQWSGTLILIQEEQGDSEENKTALTEFVDKHFEVKPGHPAFQNIANNVLSYLPRRGVTSTLKEAAQKAAAATGEAGPAEIDSDAVRRWFRLEMKEGNVVVGCKTNIPYKNALADDLKLEFQRQEVFKISGEHLRVDPTAFDAKANLLKTVRYDNVSR